MRVACVQWDVEFGLPDENADRAIGALSGLGRDGVELAIFPEAFLTGYCARTPQEAERLAIPSSHQQIGRLAEACDRVGIAAIIGFAERADDGLFNSAAVLSPGRTPRFHRKTHLPCLGLDRFVRPGGTLGLFDVGPAEIGILICFDQRHPEPARCLALQGADLIAIPTNWPEGAEVAARHICIARAAENQVYVAACNRIGEENGFRFIGESKIISPSGEVVASAGVDESIILADIQLERARDKVCRIREGEYEMDMFGSRRPELYGALVESRWEPSRR
jgi:predicted amidohydrolase